VKVAIDTNVMAYAEGIGDPLRCNKARALVEKIPLELVVLPAQTLGELYRVLTANGGFDSVAARASILSWADTFEIADSTWRAFKSAFDLGMDHKLHIWDALILSVAAENGCRILLSEDFQPGFTWHGVTVVNPFLDESSPLLRGII